MLEKIKSFFSPVGGGDEQASLHRMEIYKKGGAGLGLYHPFCKEGCVCGNFSFWNADLKEVF